jgi:glucosamine--fructose-6-phosphate aminotransferase (isomerizing)
MCGIVGYIGNKPVYDILINGLKKLEYRGYDSAGIMLYDKTSVIKKSKGKVADLESLFTNKEDKKRVCRNRAYKMGYSWTTKSD